MPESLDSRFARLVSGPEGTLDLAEAALLIGADEYPALEVRPYLARIDALAEAVRRRIAGDAQPVETVRAMNRYLFDEEGFRGNLEDYSDPRNSFLSEVLDRKLGIPITLSVLYIEIGWRLGVPLEGVSFPGHFLVKLPWGSSGAVVLDPFFGGQSLSAADLEERVQRVLGREPPEEEGLMRYLGGASKKEILLRMLRNLRNVYLEREDSERALRTMHRILLLAPDSAEELRARGELYQALECFHAALTDYRRYLSLADAGPDRDEIRERVIELGTPRLN